MTEPEREEALPAVSKLLVRALIALADTGEPPWHTGLYVGGFRLVRPSPYQSP